MASKRKAAFDALEAIVAEAMESTVRIAGWPAPPRIVRNGVMPERAPDEGLVMIRAGVRRSTGVEFGEGRVIYEIALPFSVELYLNDELQADRDEMLGRFETSIGEALAADQTLGGAVENTELAEGETDDAGDEATETLAAARIAGEMILYDRNPLV